MMKFLKSLFVVIQYLVAAAFMQIAGLLAFLAGGVAWAHWDSLWAAAGGFLLVIVLAMPVYGLLNGDIKPRRSR
ncbi:hypothetical protein ACFOZ5_01155 [Marinobacter lacisalsi]|uniref:Uncharacterized protein n=1 Tax=Marinobacter lacisalsi TaxID=475979 RepID=A0ABV8QCC5_9GAMM